LDNAVYGLEPIQDLLHHPNLDYVDGDSRNIQDVVKAMHQVSSIVHLAAIVGIQLRELDQKTTIEINLRCNANAHRDREGLRCRTVLVSPRVAAFMGQLMRSWTKTQTVEPVSLYGETKVSSEQALLESATANFHPVIMRFATVFWTFESSTV